MVLFDIKEKIEKFNEGEYISLYKKLKRYYGDKCHYVRRLGESLQFLIMGKIIVISFHPNHSLFLCVPLEEKELLEEITFLLKPFMGNEEPICSYDFQRGNGENFKTVIEWNLVEPEKRLGEIQSGQGDDVGIQNLKIYSQEIKEENMTKQKGYCKK